MSIYFQVLWKRIIYVILTFIVTVGLVGFLTSRMQPVYTASTKMLVVPFGLGAPDYATYLYSEQLTVTFTEILGSELVELEALNRLGIDKLPDFEVIVIPRSELLQVSVTDKDKFLATETSQVLAEILVEQTQSQYGANLENIVESLNTRLEELENEIDSLITEQATLLEEIPRNNIRLAEIDRLITTRESTYTQLLADYNETIRARAEQANLVSIFEPAIPPVNPSGPRMKLNLAIGGVVGLMGGIAVAFLLELLQPKLYSEKQIEETLGVPIVGRISKIKKTYRGNVFAGDQTATERFRRLRTNVQVLCRAQGANTFVIASARPDSGKSTISTNIAISLAYNKHRVILVDADAYRPTTHTLLGLSNDTGLSNVLSGEVTLSDAIQKAEIPNLFVLSTGTPDPGFSELLDSSQMKEVTEELKSDFDYVVFDAPPILATSDATILAQLVDGVFYVMPPNAPRRTILQATGQLTRVKGNIMGVIVNGVRYDPSTSWAAGYYQSFQRTPFK